jgi:hypothetical protein
MAVLNRKKGRLRLVLLVAVALGACSALLSGSLAPPNGGATHPALID